MTFPFFHNLLTYLFGYRTRVDWWQKMVWCQWFGVNMGFSDEDRSYEAKNLLKNLLIKCGDRGN